MLRPYRDRLELILVLQVFMSLNFQIRIRSSWLLWRGNTQVPIISFFSPEVSVSDQALVELCVEECLMLLSSVSRIYCTLRSSNRLPLLKAVCGLTSQFVDYPQYCVTVEHHSNPTLPCWLEELLKVWSFWLLGYLLYYLCRIYFRLSMQSLGCIKCLYRHRYEDLLGLLSIAIFFAWPLSFQLVDASDLAARATAFDLILSIYLKCSSVLAQHDAVSGRMMDGPTTVTNK